MPPAPTNGNRNAWLADELADFVAATLGRTLGVDTFVGELPEPNENGVPPSDGLYIIEMAGALPDLYLDTETHMIDFWVSTQDAKTGYTLLHEAYDILHRKANYTLTNWYIYFSYANSTIRDEGRGRENNKLLSLSFTLVCRNLNNVS